MTENSVFRAPRFKGMQQQDSHELLRYLLDNMKTEEIKVKEMLPCLMHQVRPRCEYEPRREKTGLGFPTKSNTNRPV